MKPLDNAIPLSQAIPDEYQPLKEGDSFAITAVILVEKSKGTDSWKEVRLHGLSLPGGETFVKYKTSAGAIARKCEDLQHRACFKDGSCKTPVLVRVTGNDGQNGRWLDLVDA